MMQRCFCQIREASIRERMGVGGRTHTGLIGEQAALCTLRNGGLDGVAEAAADDGLRSEGILEDHAEGRGDSLSDVRRGTFLPVG